MLTNYPIFLTVEKSIPWRLVEGIAVYSREYHDKVYSIVTDANHWPKIKIKPEWYY